MIILPKRIKYGGKKDDLKWAVKSGGRCKIVIAGGIKKSEKPVG